MNRIYKLVWNPRLRALVVASELAGGGGGRAAASGAAVGPRRSLLGMACLVACMTAAGTVRAQSAELADIQQLVERYSQPVEDLNALLARAAGQPLSAVAPASAPVSQPAAAVVDRHPAVTVAAPAARPLAVARPVRHAGLSVTPAMQVQTVSNAIAGATVASSQSGAVAPLAAVAESLAASGDGQAGAPAGHLSPMLRPRDPALGNRTNVVRHGVTGTVGFVEAGAGKLLEKTYLGKTTDRLLSGVGDVVGGVGNVLGVVVGGLTGSQALAGTVTQLADAVDDGLGQIGDNLDQTRLAGVVGAVGSTVNGAGNALVGGVTGTVGGIGGSATVGGTLGGTVDGLSGSVANGLAGLVGQLTGNPVPAPVPAAATLPLGGVGQVMPDALPPGDPRLVPGGSRTSGLVVGSGGLVGTVGSLVGPTLQDLLGGDGFVRNGDTAISSANIVQAYTVTNVLGLPLVNLSPVGTMLDGLGGVSTGSNSHLTVLGGATSDSYLYNINNGDPNGLLGLVLPDRAPDWAQTCLNVLGLVSVDCWAVNAAQDYQVLIGDGAYANGSKEVVIGTNARHQLAPVDANDAFAGDGANHPTNPSGVPTADYDARLGHSVVIGDNALGTANAQTLLGAGATSDKANSVALGFRSNAARGGQDSYAAYGIAAPQTSIGEVAVGSAGRERQITHVAAASQDTDAVNLAQLRGAIDSVVSAADPFAVRYSDDGTGAPDFTRVALGDGNAPTTVSNLAAGEVGAGSSQAINGAQLFGTASTLADALGGGATVDIDGSVAAPTYMLTSVAVDGSTSSGDYHDVGSALDAVDSSIINLNTTLTDGLAGAVHYDRDANGDIDFSQVTLGGGSGTTLLTNVAEGSVVAGSTDAVTGSQLHGNASSVATHLGGGAQVNVDGSISAPTYTLTSVAVDGSTSSGDYNDVGSAFDAVDASISNLNNSFTTGLAGAVRYDIDANGDVDYGQVTLGSGQGPTRITNLAAGSVAAGSSDAISGAQLHASASSVATVIGAGAGIDAAGNLTTPDFAITLVDADLNRSIGNYGDVGSAFDALDASINNVANNLTVAIGGAVLYDRDAAGAVDYSRVTFGNGGSATLLTNVADGTVAAGSTDAVTGGQLHVAAASVATHLGGGSVVAVDGSVTAPTYAIDIIDSNGNLVSGSYTDVGTAFDAVGQSIRNIFNTGVPGVDPLAVHYDTGAGGVRLDSITLVGTRPGNAVTIDNLAGGAVVAGSQQAVSGGQLAATNAALVSYMGGTTAFDAASGTWAGPNFSLVTVGSDGVLGTATYTDVTAAFDSISQSLSNVVNNPPPATPVTGGLDYFDVNSTKANAQALGTDSLAAGPNAEASGDRSVAIGDDATASAAGSVALGAGSVADRANTVSVGAQGQERQITHVADGSQATDAVNVRQLQQAADGMVQYDRNADGSVDYSSVTLGRQTGVDANSQVMAVAEPTRLRNVADGSAPTDAVNVGQLQAGIGQAMDWSRTYTDQRFSEIGRSIRDVDNRASAGIASAMAMAGLPQPSEAGRSMAAFAASSFNGEGSIAVGLSGVSEGGRWIYKFSGSTNTRGDGGVTVGAGIQW